MKNSCSPRVFLPILLLLALALSACQFSSSAPSKAPAPKPATPTGPHIALALPSSGPYAGVSAKIRNGAEINFLRLIRIIIIISYSMPQMSCSSPSILTCSRLIG